jgi:hypothetical protein
MVRSGGVVRRAVQIQFTLHINLHHQHHRFIIISINHPRQLSTDPSINLSRQQFLLPFLPCIYSTSFFYYNLHASGVSRFPFLRPRIAESAGGMNKRFGLDEREGRTEGKQPSKQSKEGRRQGTTPQLLNINCMHASLQILLSILYVV